MLCPAMLFPVMLCISGCGPRDSASERSTPTAPQSEPAEGAIPWIDDWHAAEQRQESEGKDLFVDFAADWCAPCKQLDARTFSEPEIATLLSTQFIPVKLNVTEQGPDEMSLMKRFEVRTLPALLVIRDGNVLLRVSNFISADDLRPKLADLPPR